MHLHTQYEGVMNQLLHCLRHDFGLGDGPIDFINTHITDTGAFRNDVLAAYRVLGGWHQSIADAVADIVECSGGRVSNELLTAFARVAAAALHLLGAQDSSQPRRTPAEQYETALAQLDDLNEAAAELEAEFVSATGKL